MDKALDARSNYLSAMVFYIAAIKAGTTLFYISEAYLKGTTCILDHHASPTSIENSLDEIANAAIQSGLSLSSCWQTLNRSSF